MFVVAELVAVASRCGVSLTLSSRSLPGDAQYSDRPAPLHLTPRKLQITSLNMRASRRVHVLVLLSCLSAAAAHSKGTPCEEKLPSQAVTASVVLEGDKLVHQTGVQPGAGSA